MNNIIAWVITTIWFLAFVAVGIGAENTDSMKLSEWGDFLAGFAAPLALFWIIIGYRLQVKELTMNRNILENQQKELSKQVAELSKQNIILLKSVDSTYKLSEAIDNASQDRTMDAIHA